jgi:hypothetical protein
VTFTPTTTGDRGGNLTIFHSGLATVIALYGSGGDFALTASVPTAAVTAGGTATLEVLLSPIGGFNQTVEFSFSGCPPAARCLMAESTASNGMNEIIIPVTVITTARSLAAPRNRVTPRGIYGPRGVPLPLWLVTLLVWAGWIAIAVLYQRRSAGRHWEGLKPAPALALTAALALTLFWTACGGGSGGSGVGGGGTPAGIYTLAVTGTYTSGSTTLTHNVTLTLTVK